MNAENDGFDLANQDGGKPSGAPAPAPTPRQGLRHPSEDGPAPTRPGTARVVRRKAPEPPAPTPTAGGLPFLFRPGFLLVLGAVVLAVLWSGSLFSKATASAGWPWTLFQTEGGAVTFRWDAAHVFTALGAFFAVFFLLTPFGPAIRSRGATVLTVVALGLVILPPLTILDRMVALLGLAAAAILAREGLRDGEGGRGFVFVALLLLGACLFFPIQPPGEAYDAVALSVGERLFVDGPFGDVILEPQTAVVLLSAVMLALALLSWIGLGGRWMVWAAGVTLYIGVFGTLALAWHAAGDASTCQEGLAALVIGLPAVFLAFTLPLAAGALDASRP